MGEGRKVASVAALNNVQRKNEVILEARREKKQVHFATLMEIFQLKNAELEPKYQKKQRLKQKRMTNSVSQGTDKHWVVHGARSRSC